MGRRDRMSPWIFAAVLMLALGSRAEASGVCLRAPQVAFQSARLQGYLNAVDGGVNVLTDQVDLQSLTSPTSNNADFIMDVKLIAGATGNQYGLYDTNDVSSAPALYIVFPSAALPGWTVECRLKASRLLIVTLFDEYGIIQGATLYDGVDRTHFGFYVQGPTGVFYSQDSRNAGRPQALSYLGTGYHYGYGDLWECFEDSPYVAAAGTFTGGILDIQTFNWAWSTPGGCATPARTSTWGSLKAVYR